MSHTNHRQGTIESLMGDWIVLMRFQRGINDQQGAGLKVTKFLELGLKHDAVNAGSMSIGIAVTVGLQKLIDEVDRSDKPYAFNVVFDSVDKTAGFLKDLVKADLGISVVVSGLHAEADRICREAGTRRHTVSYSLGVWGKTELLPHPKILEITTMCGHGMVSFDLVRHMAKAVKKGSISLQKAAEELAKPCICGIVNTTRAEALIQEYNAVSADE